jgi:type VI secretion system protein ImpD
MLTASWAEVVRDLERAADFDQSQLFEKIYTQEFGTLGGEPFGLLVGDYDVQHRPTADHPSDDIAALTSLAMIAAAAFAPLVMGVAPALFQLGSFQDLGRPFDLRAVFRQEEYRRWEAMRGRADMRFVGLVMPRILMRLPYGRATARRDGFRFEETVHAEGGTDYLWGNAAFAFAAVTLRAFANFGWFADIRGTPDGELRGGLLNDLPVPFFGTDAPGVMEKPSTDCVLSNQQEKDLSDLGFIGLRKVQYTTYSAFYGNQSIQRPARYDLPEANVNARLSCMLQYMLCVSRFTHYVKLMGRNYIGTLMTAEECQQFLQNWLLSYCEGSDDASLETKARYPLREAAIEIRETAGKPGSYSCKVFLRPHFQLDDIATGFRLVTELAPPSNAG